MPEVNLPAGLPAAVEQGLRLFLDQVREAGGQNLVSVVLFGSAAEGRMRIHSDVNTILVFKEFTAAHADAIQRPLTLAHAAIQLEAMLITESEIATAMECFAQKFGDIVRRHRVLCGRDPFEGKQVSRPALILRTRQVLLNLALRLRERQALTASRPDQTLQAISDAIGPLRTCAASLLELEGNTVPSPRDSFAQVLNSLDRPEWGYLPSWLHALRENSVPADPRPAVVAEHLVDLASSLRIRVERL